MAFEWKQDSDYGVDFQKEFGITDEEAVNRAKEILNYAGVSKDMIDYELESKRDVWFLNRDEHIAQIKKWKDEENKSAEDIESLINWVILG